MLDEIATLARGVFASVPGSDWVPGLRKLGNDPGGLEFSRETRVDPDVVARYNEICGFARKDTAPMTFPHLLAFGLHLKVLADRRYPYPMIGSVHLANSITQTSPLPLGTPVQVRVLASPLRQHPKGVCIDIATEVSTGRDVAWQGVSTYLRRGARQPHAEPFAESDLPGTVVPASTTWALPGDLGRRYAGVSGDYHPIHLTALSARALGFTRPIAHGMWSLARCVAAIENRFAATARLDVAFKLPIKLPGEVGFGLQHSEDCLAFSLTRASDGAPHLIGQVTHARR